MRLAVVAHSIFVRMLFFHTTKPTSDPSRMFSETKLQNTNHAALVFVTLRIGVCLPSTQGERKVNANRYSTSITDVSGRLEKPRARAAQ